MSFPSGIVASCTTSYGANMEGYFRVYGSKGWLEVDNAFIYQGQHLRAEYSGTKLDEPNPARDPSQFKAEAEHFSHCIQNGLRPQSPGEEGLRDMRYLTRSTAPPESQSNSLTLNAPHSPRIFRFVFCPHRRPAKSSNARSVTRIIFSPINFAPQPRPPPDASGSTPTPTLPTPDSHTAPSSRRFG